MATLLRWFHIACTNDRPMETRSDRLGRKRPFDAVKLRTEKMEGMELWKEVLGKMEKQNKLCDRKCVELERK